MTDARTMAYINMYAVLGTLENLCELDNKAKEIISTLDKPVSLAFDVKDGPSATLTFSKNGCRMEDGVNSKCDIKIPVSSCEKFNKIIDGVVTPIPTKGLTKVSFLLKTFTALTFLSDGNIQSFNIALNGDIVAELPKPPLTKDIMSQWDIMRVVRRGSSISNEHIDIRIATDMTILLLK